MNQAARVIDSRAFAAGIVLLFCVASGLVFDSDSLIAGRWGTRGVSIAESLSLKLSMTLQIYMYPLWGLRTGLGLGQNMLTSLVLSVFSAAILFCLVRWVSRRSLPLSRGILAVLLLCSCGDIYTFIGDLRLIRSYGVPRPQG